MVGMQPVTPPATRPTRVGASALPAESHADASAAAAQMLENAKSVDRPLPAEPHDPRLFHFLWGMTGDVAVAEDLEQEARLMAWHRQGDLRDPDKSAAWLYRIAANLARKHLRRQRRWRWLSWDHPDAAILSQTEPEPCDRLRQALDTLDQDDRAILLLLGHQGWSAKEVAEAAGLSREAVYKRWTRACARFRQVWESQEEP